jgi:hypothetical protein
MTERLQRTKLPKRHGDVWQVFMPSWLKTATFERDVAVVTFGVRKATEIKVVDGAAMFVEGTSLSQDWVNPKYKSFVLQLGYLVRRLNKNDDTQRTDIDVLYYFNDDIWTCGYLVPDSFYYEDDDGQAEMSLTDIMDDQATEEAVGFYRGIVTPDNQSVRAWMVLFRVRSVDPTCIPAIANLVDR